MLLFRTSEDVQIDFVYYPYTPLHSVVDKVPITLFNLADLATNKAYSIGRRGAWRDYVDLFFLLKWKYFTLEQIIAEAQKRFSGEFDDMLFVEQLGYFDDLRIEKTELLQEKYSNEEIQKFLGLEVEKFTQNKIHAPAANH